MTTFLQNYVMLLLPHFATLSKLNVQLLAPKRQTDEHKSGKVLLCWLYALQ